MGYDSRIYIVDKKDKMGKEEKRYAEVVAVFNMCKFDAFGGIFKTETDCYIYADDGNTQIMTDCYGEPLKESSVSDVITYLEECQVEREHYRRVAPLLGLLKSFNLAEWKDLVVLHYGY